MTREKLVEILNDPNYKVTYSTSTPGVVEWHILTPRKELMIVLDEQGGEVHTWILDELFRDMPDFDELPEIREDRFAEAEKYMTTKNGFYIGEAESIQAPNHE